MKKIVKIVKDKDKNKDLVLFIGKLLSDSVGSVRDLEKILGRELKIGLLTTLNKKIKPELAEKIDVLIRCNMKKPVAIEDAIMKYRSRVLTLVAKYEFPIVLLSRVAPYFPYLRLPNHRSLMISTDKMKMRETFLRYYPKISPKFVHVKKYSDVIVKKIIKEIGFPCVIKPANLTKSSLIINCFYKEELEENLQSVMKKIAALYRKAGVEDAPKVIVEGFMEGQMYSIDAYVNTYGKMYYTPIIEIKTGKDAGYDDLFMYTQIIPSVLGKAEEIKSREVVSKGAHAVGLRSCTVHCELMKTTKGWKIIELAARTGGFREELLFNSVGIKHHLNDLLIHLGNKPDIKKKKSDHVVFMKFWPHKPGKLVAIKGLKKAKELKSLVKFRQGKKIGDFAGFSKNGHSSVVGFTLATKSRSDLLGDIRRLENWIKIETVRKNGIKKKSQEKPVLKAKKIIKKKK